jgi:hypothetical protein
MAQEISTTDPASEKSPALPRNLSSSDRTFTDVAYLEADEHPANSDGALFRPLAAKRYRGSQNSITPERRIQLVREYSGVLRFRHRRGGFASQPPQNRGPRMARRSGHVLSAYSSPNTVWELRPGTDSSLPNFAGTPGLPSRRSRTAQAKK